MKSSLSVMTIFFILAWLYAIQTQCTCAGRLHTGINVRPIIGILSQELSYKLKEDNPNGYHSYIAASYVKFIEGAGARVVPIWIGKSDNYYKNIMEKINGVVFPGGATFFNNTNGYAQAGKVIYRIAKRMNSNGDYFPIFGICLGFELLTYLAASETEHRSRCSSINQALPLEFTEGFKESRMFGNASREVLDTLSTKNVTANFHQYCVTRQGLKRVSLDTVFRVTSLNNDRNGLRFISSLEHVSLPFYGVQFHPEKIKYEWVLGKSLPHGYRAATASQHFADFFVNEARKSQNHFPNATEEMESLIYNYRATYTGRQGSAFQQCYLFKKTDRVS